MIFTTSSLTDYCLPVILHHFRASVGDVNSTKIKFVFELALLLSLSIHSDPLVTKLDFDKESTPGRKHYPVHHDIREPLVQDKIPDKEEVQVQRSRNCKYWWRGRYVMTDKQGTAAGKLLMSLVCENRHRALCLKTRLYSCKFLTSTFLCTRLCPARQEKPV